MCPDGTSGFDFLRKLQLLIVQMKQSLHQEHSWKKPRVGRCLLLLRMECYLP